MAAEIIEITGRNLSRTTVLKVARGDSPDGAGVAPLVLLNRETRAEIESVRERIEERWLQPYAPVTYGVNTGCGILKDVQLSAEEIAKFNRLYTVSHCVGAGDSLKGEVVRASMLVRANQLASGHSGVRAEVIDGLLGLLNAGVTPLVPAGGSLGASGDLAPLSHIAAVLIGEPRAEVLYAGIVMPASEALDAAGFKPLALGAKEGMALNNGATVSLGHAVLTGGDADDALETAHVAAALSLEAIRGETAAFDARIHGARGFRSQRISAARVRRLIEGSVRMTESVRRRWLGAPQEAPASVPPRVQDAYSFRCVPQVHGAAYDALRFLRRAITDDLNAATDNPLIFADDEAIISLSGGNFLGLQLAQAADLAAMALVKVAQASERRTFRLLNPSLSFQLPEQLSGGKPGLNSGLMIAQYTQASLVNECAVLAGPASIHPAVTSGGQEDLASMSLFAVRKLGDIVARVQVVLAIELLCAAQGVTSTQTRLGHPRLGVGTGAALRAIRGVVDELGEDRYLYEDVSNAVELVRSGRLLRAVRCAFDTGEQEPELVSSAGVREE